MKEVSLTIRNSTIKLQIWKKRYVKYVMCTCWFYVCHTEADTVTFYIGEKDQQKKRQTKQAPPGLVFRGFMFSWCKVARRWPGSQCRWLLRSGLQFYTTWPAGTLPLFFSAVSRSLACKCPPSNTPDCWGLGTPGSEETRAREWFRQQALVSSPLILNWGTKFLNKRLK